MEWVNHWSWPQAAVVAAIFTGIQGILELLRRTRRDERKDVVRELYAYIETLKQDIVSGKLKEDEQDREIGRLRDMETACRAENAVLSGRIHLLDQRNRAQVKRLYRLERKLEELGVEGSWLDRAKKKDVPSIAQEEIEGNETDTDTTG